MRGNRKFLAGAIAGAAVCSLVVICAAWNTLPNDDTFVPGPTTFAKDVRVTDGSLYLSGTQVTANAATLNAAGGGTTATLAPTLVSNATLKVYAQTIVVPAGGTLTIDSAVFKAAISNLFTATSINGTNYYMLAYP
jgi:hypothetical protein